jgi:hypothetical protein
VLFFSFFPNSTFPRREISTTNTNGVPDGFINRPRIMPHEIKVSISNLSPSSRVESKKKKKKKKKKKIKNKKNEL